MLIFGYALFRADGQALSDQHVVGKGDKEGDHAQDVFRPVADEDHDIGTRFASLRAQSLVEAFISFSADPADVDDADFLVGSIEIADGQHDRRIRRARRKPRGVIQQNEIVAASRAPR